MSDVQIKPGTWTIDPDHTEIAFTVRHMMVSKVRGRFDKFSSTMRIDEDPAKSSVEATIDASSIDTGQEDRDNHIRSADFFEVDKHPSFLFKSTGIRPAGDDFVLTGDLTIKGNTRPVELKLEFNGTTVDPYGNDRAGFHAETEIERSEFGVDIKMPMDGGGVVVGERIKIEIDAEYTRQQ
ncbi:YceI family protein [Spiractinospora alimapuensis]|uniref:YceI family protein n=1 Tax=Spiractinospora alimapuensis TaxID=2820884 RepID=UPI001F19ADFD|nr:YceI family protein [Spiractinospora alimapuensis]QVQ53155.1 YceI family protein [Spiractinospora alimapuensis]